MINFLLRKSAWGLEKCEDSVTSIVFETLSLLPSNILWQILCDSSRIKKEFPGKLLNIEFWPHWNPTSTSNTNFVEPDVLLEFEQANVIIEAKIGLSNLQAETQWSNECIAYSNEFSKNLDKKVFLIAVDGNLTFEPTKIDGFEVYKTSWDKLYNTILSYSSDIEPAHLKLINLSFRLIGKYGYKDFSDLLQRDEILLLEAVDYLKVLNKQIQ